MNVEADQILEEALDADEIVQGEGTGRIIGDEHVEIAVLASLAARAGAENGESDDAVCVDFVGMRPQTRNQREPVH